MLILEWLDKLVINSGYNSNGWLSASIGADDCEYFNLNWRNTHLTWLVKGK